MRATRNCTATASINLICKLVANQSDLSYEGLWQSLREMSLKNLTTGLTRLHIQGVNTHDEAWTRLFPQSRPRFIMSVSIQHEYRSLSWSSHLVSDPCRSDIKNVNINAPHGRATVYMLCENPIMMRTWEMKLKIKFDLPKIQKN